MYKKLKLVESANLNEKLNSFEKITFSKKALEAETDEDLKKIIYEIKPYSEPTYTRCMEILNGDGSTQYKAGQISDILYQLNESLKESNFDKAQAVLPLSNTQAIGIIVSDDGETVQYMYSDDDSVYESEIEFDEEGNPFFKDEQGEKWMISDFMRTNLGESIVSDTKANLTEALDDEEVEGLQDKAEEDLENQKDLEDTLDSEEDQEENPVEEESDLDKQLDELRDILVDLDLNLYQITDKEDLNNSIYVIGKVADESNDILMLVDTQPEEVNSEEIPEEEPIIDNIDTDEELKESEEPVPRKLTREEFNKEFGPGTNPDVINAGREPENRIEIIDEAEEIDLENNEEPEEDNKTELEQRFDFVKLPNTFEEVNKLNPRYGEELTPDHESIVEYLMNCLIETNPKAAEELQKEDNEETPIEPEEDIDLNIDIDGEEDLEDEDQY